MKEFFDALFGSREISDFVFLNYDIIEERTGEFKDVANKIRKFLQGEIANKKAEQIIVIAKKDNTEYLGFYPPYKDYTLFTNRLEYGLFFIEFHGNKVSFICPVTSEIIQFEGKK